MASKPTGWESDRKIGNQPSICQEPGIFNGWFTARYPFTRWDNNFMEHYWEWIEISSITLINTYKTNGYIGELAFSPDNKYLASTEQLRGNYLMEHT